MARAAPPESQQRQLSREQADWVHAAWAAISMPRAAELLEEIVGIPSPTGREGELARHLASTMADRGIDAREQTIDEWQANAIGRLHGHGDGPSLLLYAPIDTAFSGSADDEMPWLGEMRDDFLPRAVHYERFLVGLGAENPKAYVTAIVEAGTALRAAGVPLRGDLLIGLGAGGMPANAPAGSPRQHVGQGVGCSFMLEQGFRGDFAIIAKPGYAVAWEEVGLAWFRLRIRGDLGYAGIRHLLPTRNPIVAAARVVEGLESWFPEFTRRHEIGLVRPQGHIGAVTGGWPHKPAFSPAACDVYVDLRLAPGVEVGEVHRELREALDAIAAKTPGFDVSSEMILAVPGTRTDPENWIVRSLIGAWEAVEGRPHEPIVGTSGATDAAILRGRGVPTARLGFPRVTYPAPYDGFSMGIVDPEAIEPLIRCLVYAAVDTCTRSAQEAGLGGTGKVLS